MLTSSSSGNVTIAVAFAVAFATVLLVFLKDGEEVTVAFCLLLAVGAYRDAFCHLKYGFSTSFVLI